MSCEEVKCMAIIEGVKRGTVELLILTLLQNEDMYADVVSSGELYTALSAGFDASHLIFHGNNKTSEDINYAVENGIGLFVADNIYELENISSIAIAHNICQNILV